jgi:hypothetical protein
MSELVINNGGGWINGPDDLEAMEGQSLQYNQADLDQDLLPLPTMNWAEEAERQRNPLGFQPAPAAPAPTMNAGEDDLLPLPTMNWAEEAERQRRDQRSREVAYPYGGHAAAPPQLQREPTLNADDDDLLPLPRMVY